MAPTYSHLQLSWLIVSFFGYLSYSLKLQPITLTSASLAAGSLHSTSLALRNNESFLWSSTIGDSTTLATLTLHTPDDGESIISLERLQGLTTSIKCSNDTIALQLNDASAYVQLRNQWDWMNQAENNTVILVTGAGQCDWNEDRQPFSISSFSYSNNNTELVLSGSRVEWREIASNYHLHMSTMAQTALSRRDYTGDYTLDFNHQLGFGNWSFPIDPTFSVGLTCKTCYTTGDFAFEFDLKTELGIPVDATLTIAPRNVSVVLDPTFSLSGNIGSSLSFKETFLRIPIDGIAVAGIIDLGPEIAFTGSLNIGPLKGTASVTARHASVEDQLRCISIFFAIRL
ncbi:conserved hypothetical protein [Talaromyces stipitatus ATCC 10500]|uniref:GPI anchored protein n=1 Tax=Talaromyces stipitatus (strain ATCC 10500 / CBS 375.48 / QM 6759 / NRRL 1006) TaxID=441959 RepID=B8M445_TALSN|nr:uncharacterized protein TSTA_039820 [Talaromyces stipitatus ATCC 10500]EED20788.1 conserved hypothetical protein [Talaromyces stipitatus ATCC 10500]